MRIVNRIKQFFCKHKDEDINVEFSIGEPYIVMMPVEGNQIQSITMMCRKCGKRIGRFRMYGTDVNSIIDNKIHNAYMINFPNSSLAQKTHSEWMLKMMLRKGEITPKVVASVVRTEIALGSAINE